MGQQPAFHLLIGAEESSHRRQIEQYLQVQCGFGVTAVPTTDDLLSTLAEADGRFQLLLIPHALPGTNPNKPVVTLRRFLPFLHKQYPDLMIILLSDANFSAVQLRKIGIRQQLPACPALPALGLAVQDAAEYWQLKQLAMTNQQETAEWRREMLHTQSQLSKLRQTTRAMTNQAERDDLLCLILQQAVTLLGGKSGGIYEYDPTCEKLTVVVEYGRTAHTANGVTLQKGEGMAGQLVATGEPYLIVDRYADFAGKAGLFATERPDNAVVEVLLRLKWHDRIMGVLYIDDEVGREFTPKDARQLAVFADQAAIAMANADLQLRDSTKVTRLQKLSLAASQIMSQLGRISQDALLELVARHATEILEAEAGSILLARRPGYLRFEASYGYTDKGIKKGREFAIRTGSRTGLTGHIAHEKKLFNAHGKALRQHPAVRGRETPYMKSQECYGMLAIPLLHQPNEAEEPTLLGLLRLDNKKGQDGSFGPHAHFTQEDEWIGRLLAETVVVAIESARLVAEISERKSNYARLLATAVDGVITNNRAGNVTFYNAQAQRILGYTRQQVLGMPVRAIFYDSQESRRITEKLLLADDGQLRDYETVLLDVHNKPVPILLSATWQYDADGEKTGVVGYFRDLRTVAETQRRLDLIVSASNMLSQADNLAVGLQNLAQMMVRRWDASFCRIFLLDEEQQILDTQAIYPLQATNDGWCWEAKVGLQTAVSDWPRLDELLTDRDASLIRRQGRQGQRILDKWTQQLNLSQPIQSLLVVPLRSGDRVVGLMDLGELRPEAAASMTEEKQNLAIALAKQTAVLIDRLNLYEQTRRRNQLFESLDETSRNIRGIKESPVLLREVIRLAAGLVNCEMGGLFINSPHMAELTLSDVYGLQTELIGSILTHSEGMIGQVARLGETRYTNQYDQWPNRASLWRNYNFATMAAIPLRHAGEVEAVLFVVDEEANHRLNRTDIEVLERFALQAAIALHTAQIIGREQRLFSQLKILHRIGNYIQSSTQLEKILHVVLTGVTAGYGLGFNRAAILLLDDMNEHLVGSMGIGHFEAQKSHQDWARDHREGLFDFGRYLELLDLEGIKPTPVGEAIARLKVPLQSAGNDLLSRVMVQRKSLQVTQYEYDRLPAAFVELFQPDWPLVVVPLLARDQAIGLLVADNKFTKLPITREDEERLLTFANTAAMGIEKNRLLVETEISRNRLRSYYSASNTLVLSPDPDLVWRDIVHQAQKTAHASGARMVLIDVEAGSITDLIVSDSDDVDVESAIRPNGLSMAVMESGKPQIVEDFERERERANPSFFQRGIRAAVGLPVSVNRMRIGVMWVYYSEPRRFVPSEVEALQLYVNQAAIAYENARRLKELEHLRQAAESLAVAADVQAVLEQIVLGARQVLQADSAVIWSYDNAHRQFDLDNSIHSGISPQVWQKHIKSGPSKGGTAETAMEQGWIGVQNVEDVTKYHFIGESTHGLLRETGVCSFQGIALRVGEERLGVLYVNYNKLHSFSPEEQDIARTFANHAALALRNARLLNRLGKARQVTSIVAKFSTLAKLEETLRSVVVGTHEALGCDAVTLHVYDQEKDKVVLPPTMYGIWDERPFHQYPTADSPVTYMLRHGAEIQIADAATEDQLFAESNFMAGENVASYVAVRLCVGVATVGVMFIYHRQLRHFTEEELEHIELFANQAAVAIYNGQLFERREQRAAVLRAIYAAGQAVNSTLQLDEVLNHIAEQGWRLVSFPNRQITYASIWLRQGQDAARLVAAYPPEELQHTRRAVGGNVIHRSARQNGQNGILWRVFDSGCSTLVENVQEDPDYLPSHEATRSELVVPIIVEQEVVGVINVEHSEYDAFDEENTRALEALAAQAAIAMQNARLYQKVVRHAELLDAAATVASYANSLLDEEQLLKDIVHIISDSIHVYHVAVFLLDKSREFAVMRSASSVEGEGLIAHHFKLSVNSQSLVGTAVRRGEYLLVSDVQQDDRFWPNPELPETKAELAFPLKVQGEVVGVLDVQCKKVLELADEDVRALQTMANQLANAIQNARLFAQARAQTSALQVLYDAGQAVISSLDIRSTLTAIVQKAWELTEANGRKARFSCILMQNGTQLDFVAAHPPSALAELQKTVQNIPLEQKAKMAPGGITGRAFKTGLPQLVDDVQQDPDYIIYDEATRSELVVPIRVDNEIIGVINIEHPEASAFSQQDQDTLVSLAAQAAIAIRNAEAYREAKILQQLGLDLASTLDLDEILQSILDSAMSLTSTTSGSILFWDAEHQRYFPAYASAGPGQKPALYSTSARVEGGFSRYVIEQRKPFIIYDSLVEENINPMVINKGRRSLIGVPVQAEGRVIAVLHVHSAEPRRFFDHQVTLLQTLANQAGMAIMKAKQYEELKRTKGLVGARTALAWMGMASNAWRHSIEGDAVNIRNLVDDVLPEVTQLVEEGVLPAKVTEDLRLIATRAEKIFNHPITPPLSSEEGAAAISVNELVRERLAQLWQDDKYACLAVPELALCATEQVSVWVSPEWLRLALDLVVDNAIEAMAGCAVQQLRIETAVSNTNLDIIVQDSGKGIPPELVPILFEYTEIREPRRGNLGRGLLMVQAILQTYGGDIRVHASSPSGTQMAMCLPVYEQVVTG
ncbi:MAG: GAF domain-containing protein [Ardenticatenaceae bacterium]|nr:GAF domain-containing protein [Anaerolineales bacterium]MCB8937468.1 GAF domain-containing protein [Ardenticatenaceae bacterium]MCB8975551.1 GAF domain-containing protein [Ardenticatenaceae bacterium]